MPCCFKGGLKRCLKVFLTCVCSIGIHSAHIGAKSQSNRKEILWNRCGRIQDFLKGVEGGGGVGWGL